MSLRGTHGALLVAGTASGVGKSTFVTGLCRLLHREGVRVAPFKAQNMSNHSAVVQGGEIGRAQYAQAQAASVEPEVAMNPVLLKPTGDRSSQLIVGGAVVGTVDASEFGRVAPSLLTTVVESFADLRSRFDVVVAEGAGGMAEVNLLDRDIVNLPFADAVGVGALMLVDIDRGGAFSSAFGAAMILPPHLRRRCRGIVLNRFRGDASLLSDGIAELERRTGIPVLGVLPFMDGPMMDGEDSLDLDRMLDQGAPSTAGLDVAVVRFPCLANATDLDPLAAEPELSMRFVTSGRALGRPDLIVLPGTKATVADLAWLRACGLADALRRTDAVVVGLCGGFQMLGRVISDHGVESGPGSVDGLGLLPARTEFARAKVVRRVSGTAMQCAVEGYQIHHGRVTVDQGAQAWLELGSGPDGAVVDGRVFGSTVHGLFEGDQFRRSFLTEVARRAGVGLAPSPMAFADRRRRHHDRLADLLEMHVDIDRLRGLIAEAA